MRRITTALVGVTTLMFAAEPGQASFVGLQLVRHATVETPTGPKSVYRIYARFSEPTDSVMSWGGNAANPTIIRTRRCNSMEGLNFYNPNPGFAGNRAPSQKAIDAAPEIQWDTFATIGVSIAEQGSGPAGADQTLLSPGFPTFINGNQVTIDDGSAVTVPLNTAQAQANYAGDGDAELRVLLMQLTTDIQDFVSVTIGNLTWRAGPDGPSLLVTNLSLDPVAAYGICCVPDNTCINVSAAACATIHNGTFLGCAECADCTQPCEADVDGSGAVDVDDLIAVILGWGPCGKPCPADTDNSGEVDVDDLVAVILGWGDCG